MKFKSINGISAEALQREADQGARFVHYVFSISLILVTFKRQSGVYVIRAGEKAAKKGIPFTLLSIFFGWWGIPNGPRYTLQSILTNLRGGKDVTDEVTATVAGHLLFREAQQRKKMKLD